jgi:hypothetical protein
VTDREDLVEAVDERAVLVRVSALGLVAAQAEVAVAEREQRLGDADVIERSARLRGATGRSGSGRDPSCPSFRRKGRSSGDESREIVDDERRAEIEQRLRPGAAVDADDEAEAGGRRRRDAGVGVLDGGAAGGSTPSMRAPAANMSGAGLERSPSRAATTPSTTTGKKSRMPAIVSTSSAFFELDTTPIGVPAARSCSISASDPGYGAMPSVRSTRANTSFLRLPMPQTVSAVVGSDGSPHGTSTSRERRRLATPS